MGNPLPMMAVGRSISIPDFSSSVFAYVLHDCNEHSTQVKTTVQTNYLGPLWKIRMRKREESRLVIGGPCN